MANVGACWARAGTLNATLKGEATSERATTLCGGGGGGDDGSGGAVSRRDGERRSCSLSGYERAPGARGRAETY